ncbi:Iron-uptake system-binding protein precursor [compost metagenome]
MDQEYEVPAKAERIVITGAMEAMEDALLLDVHPVGAISVGGKFPEQFASITGESQSIGEKTEPNFETILSLKPDVILGTTKFPAETVEQLQKIGTFIQVSHIAANWEANLELMGELTGKEDQAKQIIADYKKHAEEAKVELGEKLKDKKIISIRIRRGGAYIYPETVFLNGVLYGDLGFTAPDQIKAVKAQEEITPEQLAELNPDYIFVQASTAEDEGNQKVLEEWKSNPIVSKVNAIKENHIFENVIEPLSEGGPAWSRTNFIDKAVDLLSK